LKRKLVEGHVAKFLFAAVAMMGMLLGNQAATAQQSGIDGKWHFVLDTPGGDREREATFAVDADGKVSGKFGEAAVAGTFKDGQLALDFQVTSEESGETAAMKLTGKVDESGALVGTWEFSSYSGSYKATRPKP
jgi:hypothetical protein